MLRLHCNISNICSKFKYFSLNRVSYPNKLTAPVEADSLQKLIMKFSLKDKSTGKLMTVHQAFVKLHNAATNQEIVFVAEPDSAKVYKFDIVSTKYFISTF